MIRIIVPCYNEAANLPSLVTALQETLKHEPYQLYAVNDGSTDTTAAVLTDCARTHPITILTHQGNKGVAAAFRTGFTAAVREAADDDVIALMEGDQTSTPALLPEMVRRVRGGSDVVIASRYRPGGGYKHFPLKRLILSRGANVVFRLFFPIVGATDYSIFYRAYRVPPLRAAMQHHGDQFIASTTFLANAEILVKLKPFIRRVDEVPLFYDYGKKRGKSGMKVWKNLKSYLVFVGRNALRKK
jgi:dolichol-phosphate mannosyltransferase